LRNEALIGIAGVLLVAVCCAGPVLLAGAGASLALAALRVHLAVVVVPLAAAALIAAAVLLRGRRSSGNASGARRS
jgi:hypothetical protein